MLSFVRVAVAAFILIFSQNLAHAVVCGPSNGINTEDRLRIPVVDFRQARGPRQSVPEYAKSNNMKPEEAEEKFAATGRLDCGDDRASANLVVKGDILLTARHMFKNSDTCAEEHMASACTFTASGQKPIEVASLIASGAGCPDPYGENDWAILKLSRPVEGVTPYKLKQMGSRDGISPQDVVAVAAQSVDFTRPDPNTKKRTMVKTVQNCEIKDVFYRFNPITVGSTCGGSLGKSGGALINADLKQPTIMGITVRSPLTEAELARERRTGRPVVKDYAGRKVHDIGVAIIGPLYDELEKATR